MFKYSVLLVVSFFASLNASAQYYKTLPQGVRLFVYRNIKTDTINSSYNRSSAETPFTYEIEANIRNLEAIEEENVQAMLDLVRPYDDAYNAIDLGTYRIDAEADIEVDGYGMAYGLSKRVTAYMAIPVFNADIRMRYQRSQYNSFNEVSELLQNYTNDSFAQGIGENLEKHADKVDLNGETIQNLVVNEFGYKPLGNWNGSGLGDIEFGLLYNFYEHTDGHGALLTVGGVAPTGRVDDPDVIQDIGFGDGQWDAFVELGGSYTFNKWFTANSFFRYTYQFASEKQLRVPTSEDVFISAETGTFEEKLGNRFMYVIDTDITFNDWISVTPGYEYNYIGKSEYNSEFGDANQWLAQNTEAYSHNFRLITQVSSLTAFLKQKFILPASVKFIYQTQLDAMNMPKVDRYEFEFRMYF